MSLLPIPFPVVPAVHDQTGGLVAVVVSGIQMQRYCWMWIDHFSLLQIYVESENRASLKKIEYATVMLRVFHGIILTSGVKVSVFLSLIIWLQR